MAYLHHDGTVSVCAYNLSYNQTGNAAFWQHKEVILIDDQWPSEMDFVSTGVDIVASGGTTWVCQTTTPFLLGSKALASERLMETRLGIMQRSDTWRWIDT